MDDSHFFEIPIYRCTKAKFQKEQDKMGTEIHNELAYVSKAVPDFDYTETENAIFRIRAYPYEYNDVVGWIKLHVLGSQLRGEYYFEVSPNYPYHSKRRINKGIRRKRFELIGKAFEMSVYRNMNSNEIFDSLCERLELINKTENPFKNRHFDLTNLLRIGPYIDWRNLIEDLNPYNK